MVCGKKVHFLVGTDDAKRERKNNTNQSNEIK